jgi:TfoX/Sxy family transcriptional regulator of competence genes
MPHSKTASPSRHWQPASDAWNNAFDAALPQGVERRKMFGYPAAFVHGNMAAGLHEAGLVLRLGPDDREALLSAGGKPFEPMPGRPMKDFVVAPAAMASHLDEVAQWLGRAVTYAKSLPVKEKKQKQGR